MNPYKVLGVPRDASESEIRRAYHRIARETHPDKRGDSRLAEYKAATDAYEVLSDPVSRGAYDRDSRPAASVQDLLVRSGGRRFLSAVLPHAPAARRDGEDLVVSVREEDGLVTLTDPHDPSRVLQVPTPRVHKMCRVEGLGAEGSGGGSRGVLYIIPANPVGDKEET